MSLIMAITYTEHSTLKARDRLFHHLNMIGRKWQPSLWWRCVILGPSGCWCWSGPGIICPGGVDLQMLKKAIKHAILILSNSHVHQANSAHSCPGDENELATCVSHSQKCNLQLSLCVCVLSGTGRCDSGGFVVSSFLTPPPPPPFHLDGGIFHP